MGNSLRCCLACALPCGALDVVRIVHLSGHFEEYSRQVSAGEIMAANPNYILTRPCSQGITDHKILILLPDSELKRGNIYFLIPESSLPNKDKMRKKNNKKKKKSHMKVHESLDQTKVAANDQVILERKPGRRHLRRSSRTTTIWKPQLESISEEP